MLRRPVTYLIAAVWFVNGIWAKILHGVPRHEQIVARILGDAWARPLTVAIGVGEVAIGLWVLSRRWPRWCAVVQIALVLAMNVLEAWLAPDLLLHGRWNAFWALLFAAFLYVTMLRPKTTTQPV